MPATTCCNCRASKEDTKSYESQPVTNLLKNNQLSIPSKVTVYMWRVCQCPTITWQFKSAKRSSKLPTSQLMKEKTCRFDQKCWYLPNWENLQMTADASGYSHGTQPGTSLIQATIAFSFLRDPPAPDRYQG